MHGMYTTEQQKPVSEYTKKRQRALEKRSNAIFDSYTAKMSLEITVLCRYLHHCTY